MYKLELDKVVKKIADNNYKKVLVQLPDGLKPRAAEVVDALSKSSDDVQIYIWFSSCFGACDLPTNMNMFDLFVAFGHNKFNREDGW